LTFKLSFNEDILAFFNLATILATFSNVGQIFFSIFWSPCCQVTESDQTVQRA
jgi:hypothetical protein